MISMPDYLFHLFKSKGQLSYGENISMEEHMLQSAHFSMQAGEPPALVLASLLHDVGHFTHRKGLKIADMGIDGFHEESGAKFLEKFYPPDVVEPIRLHVKAKRYLCYVQSGYLESLSDASVQSLKLQGGVMCGKEAAEFACHPFFEESLRLRKYDELGKQAILKCDRLEDYRNLMKTLLRPRRIHH